MIIGAMNHPGLTIEGEIKWMAEMGLDFIDLTLEPPAAAPWIVRPDQVRAALASHGLKVIGHTAYYLPIGSAFESVRRAAVGELRQCLKIFSEIGARWMNIHPDGHVPFHSRDEMIQRNILSLRELMAAGQDLGVGLMIENLPGEFNSARQLSDLLEPLPELGLHLDIGHSNLRVESNTCREIIQVYASRLRHVHLHDNKGGAADLHLPLGAGNLETQQHLATLKAHGYDGTITLEVFSADRAYLAHSRDVLRRMWDSST